MCCVLKDVHLSRYILFLKCVLHCLCLSLSYGVHLKPVSEFSRNGLINEKYCILFLSSIMLINEFILTCIHDFIIFKTDICMFQVQSLTYIQMFMDITNLCITVMHSQDRWNGLFILWDISTVSDFYIWQHTIHLSAQLESVSMSNGNKTAYMFGEYTSMQ